MIRNRDGRKIVKSLFCAFVAFGAFGADFAYALGSSNGARYGGVALHAGPYTVEVFVQPDNREVLATIAVAGGDAAKLSRVRLTASVQCAASHESVPLYWIAQNHEFSGHLNCAKPVTGTLSVSLTDGEQTYKASSGVAPAIPRPRFGGFVVSAGPYVFELLPYMYGGVEVLPRDSLTFQNAEELALRVALNVATEERITLPLAWDARRHRFMGRTPMNIPLKYGAVDVLVADRCTKAERHFEGSLESVTPLPPPRSHGLVISTGTYTVELNYGTGGVVEASILDRFARQPSAARVQLIVHALDAAKNVYPVAMNWNPDRRKYTGLMKIRSSDVQSFYARVEGGDASADPYEAAYNLIGRVQIRDVDDEWKRAKVELSELKHVRVCEKH